MDLFPGPEQEDHGLMTKRENTELGPVCSRKLSLVLTPDSVMREPREISRKMWAADIYQRLNMNRV